MIYQESLQSPIALGWLWTALGVQSAQSAVHPHPGGMVLGPCQQFVCPLLCDTGLYQSGILTWHVCACWSVMWKNWSAIFKVKITVRAYIIRYDYFYQIL